MLVRINSINIDKTFDCVDKMSLKNFSGKTCLVRRFTQGVFPPGQGATIGVDFMIKTVVVDNEKIKVSIHLCDIDICAFFPI